MRAIKTVAGALVLSVAAIGTIAGAAQRGDNPLCGTGANATICFASVDRAGKVKPEQRARLAAAAPKTIDALSSPEYLAELTAFHASIPAEWLAANPYWKDLDPKAAIASSRAAFAGLHIDTIGGLRARFSATFLGNLAYEGETVERTGERNILLNRYRLNRPLGEIAATYVHEAAHKGGYSHRGSRSDDQRCDPPYVMGQLAQKLVEPDKWAAAVASGSVCRFWGGALSK